METPSTPQERVEVAEQALTVYFSNTQAAFAGVGASLSKLARNFELHTASGNPSLVVECVLAQLGVRALIGRPFGSDLLGSYKDDLPRFYESILASIGAHAAQVIVIDDMDGPLQAARELGAATVKVGAASECCDLVIATLTELPEQIGRLAGRCS